MIVREIVRTCSNPHVARAAVASIGGDFARRFTRDAAKRNLTSGLFAAGLVRRFSRQAAARDWEGVGEATRGADQPILSGLRYILERGVELDEATATPIPSGAGLQPRRSRPAVRLCGIDRRRTALKPALVSAPGGAHNASPCILGLTAEPPDLRRF